jgi:hypothetical protein
MIVKAINKTEVTAEDLNQYKKAISNLEGITFSGNDVGIDKRIITLRFGGEYDELTLVNPVVTERSDNLVVYYEKDLVKKKTRKTARHTSFSVETDNLGLVEFKADKSSWKNNDEFMADIGLFECVIAQRLIDSIDGIDVTHPTRRYTTQITAKKTPGRNERVMLQSPEGEMEFVKYKKAQTLLNKGYQLV